MQDLGQKCEHNNSSHRAIVPGTLPGDSCITAN